MKTNRKKLITLLLSGVLAGTGMFGTTAGTLSVCAEEALVDINFDDGETGRFGTYMNGGEFVLQNENGELVCAITSCGSLDYANQAYYDGFSLVEGCVYSLSFDAHCDIERKIEYRIQLNGGDYHGYVSEFAELGTDVRHIETEFTMEEASDPAPRMAFNMGLAENMTADPGAHNIYIDNLKLVLIDDSNAVAADDTDNKVHLAVNQVGYRPGDIKTVVTDASFAGKTFRVMAEDTYSTALFGTFGEAIYDAATDREVCQGDFTALERPGYYMIEVQGENGTALSYRFRIGDDVYNELWVETLKMLTRQRCGMAVDEALAGDFAHPECHMTEAVVYGTEETKEVNGGWHDAGDYGRYVVTGAQTIAQLFLTYDDSEEGSLIQSDELGIPESGNGIPDILDETRYELEWLLKMQDEATGGVYHKVSCQNFPGTVMSEEETEQLILSPISVTATGDFAAIMAKACMEFAEIDEAFAQQCLDAALRAWDYLENTEDMTGFTNPPDIFTGEYPDEGLKDEIFWAAAELYLVTEAVGEGEEPNEETAALTAILKETLEEGMEAGLGWIEMGAYGMYDLTGFASSEAVMDLRLTAMDTILEQADKYLELTGTDGYFCSLGTNYPWGSNMGVASNGMLLHMAGFMTGDTAYMEAAKKQLDYLLGVNGMDFCYVSGFGTNCLADPHHRPSQNKGHAMPGMLSGGPNMNLEDPYAGQVLAGKAPGLCYVDNQQSYSVNEVAIYWNSPLIYLIGKI